MATAPTTGVSDRGDLSIDRSDAATSRRVTAVDRWLAAAVQRTIADGPVRLELWDGRRADGAPDRAAGTCSSAIAGRSSAWRPTPTCTSAKPTWPAASGFAARSTR